MAANGMKEGEASRRLLKSGSIDECEQQTILETGVTTETDMGLLRHQCFAHTEQRLHALL
jgi:hypothetical protein